VLEDDDMSLDDDEVLLEEFSFEEERLLEDEFAELEEGN
jgi:hypothetical protein